MKFHDGHQDHRSPVSCGGELQRCISRLDKHSGLRPARAHAEGTACSRDGELLFNAHFPPNDDSYRAFRFPWSADLADDPAVAVERGSDGDLSLYASWNGATEVATWEVLAGSHPDQLEPLGEVPRSGFETALLARTAEPYVAVRAKDSSGRVLGTSKPVESGI